MASARVNSKGEITLPKSILERLGVKAGDQVEFVEYGQGAVLLRSIARDIRALKGIVPKPAKSISVETMNLAITKMGRPRGLSLFPRTWDYRFVQFGRE